ncbi:hypothetical protein QWJ34_17550 [Saccharibacillus sp. CPCC 101409]|uniref:hypothetical protein n=1 Tax=Saccharibacillus sp. CPCC 101409 TaxID=3058041 RepID=UPI002671E928|nr:hypothetical protein [Saccharibacillus sp. CPCC 101409]MDO3411573.1 hypothetical protein [Saccharibacillus sp. CPCC 101409]
MKKISFLLMLLLSTVAAGCSQQQNVPEKAEQTSVPLVENKPSNEAGSNFQEGVAIDISDYQNNESYQPVLKVLEQNMQAWVKNDKAAFEATYATKKLYEGDLFLIDTDDRFRFIGKPTIIDRDEGRIDINVQYEVESADTGQVKETGATYNMKQDAIGEWKIIQID